MEESVKLAMLPPEISSDDKTRANVVVEGRNCPLCKSAVRLFFVNYYEKLLMCENEECEFPFGYEELQIFTVDSCGQSEAEDEAASVYTRDSATGATSIISTSAWSEIDKLVRCCEEDTVPETSMNTTATNEKILRDNEIKKNLDALSKLSTELNNELKSNNKKVTIRKEKWLRSLHTIQEASGINLLKPEEVKLLTKKEPVIGLGELRIDIGQDGEDDVKIEIHNQPKFEIHNQPSCSKETGDPPV